MYVVITDSRNNILFPTTTTNGVLVSLGGWYRVEGVTSQSKELVLRDETGTGILVRRGLVMRVWFGEDLRGMGERDNEGKVCVDVFAGLV